MSPLEEKYLLALIRVPQIGLINKKTMLENFGSAQRIFEEIDLYEHSPFYNKKIIRVIKQFND